MRWIQRHALLFAWLVSLVGFALSFYFGEILRLEACRLCWYQRIALFPLPLLLGVACYRNDRPFALYALLLSCVGELFALYQVLEGFFPRLRAAAMCGYVNDCSNSGFEWFGFLTFPMVSAVGFLFLLIFSLLALRGR